LFFGSPVSGGIHPQITRISTIFSDAAEPFFRNILRMRFVHCRKEKNMKKIIPLALVVLLAACSALAPSEFDQNLKKWDDANVTHYRYALFIGCFCPFMEKMPLTVEVGDGEVVSIVTFDGTPLNPEDPAYEFIARYATMERIFAELEADLSGEADEVAVTYDPVHGFPASIAVDRIKEAIDDELSIQVSDFEVLE
jgi:hypothetical protein